jgi:hypothetical protein
LRKLFGIDHYLFWAKLSVIVRLVKFSLQMFVERMCWHFRTIYGGLGSEFKEPKNGFQGIYSASLQYVVWRADMSNRAVVPACQAGNRFLDSLKYLQIQTQATKAGGIDSLKSNPGPLKVLKYRFWLAFTAAEVANAWKHFRTSNSG